MMRHLISFVASATLCASPVAGQTITLKNSRDNLARVSGQPTAQSLKEWWRIFMGLPSAKPPVGDIVPPELGVNLDKIPALVPSNFNTANLIESGWPAATKATEGVGAFRFLCSAGDVKRDDPIVYPGQPGKSHLHQFFGNTLADANSTYASLRSTGDSTCVNKLNRSAYWIPAMLDGTGKVVRPDYVVIYYKGLAPTDQACTTQAKACVPLPRGLRYIFGYDMVTGKSPTGAAYFSCEGPTAKSGHYALIGDAAPNCGPSNRFGAIISSPQCWDGKHLDSPNHRDHMAYPQFGYTKCPDSHPYIVPVFSLAAWYSTDAAIPIGQPGSVSTWSLSSDSMNMDGKMVQMPAGSTFHADWFGAWDEDVMLMWQRQCIEGLLSCNSGDLGNGKALKPSVPFKWTAEPRTVPIPAV